jgi:uncharacterized protein DUF3179
MGRYIEIFAMTVFLFWTGCDTGSDGFDEETTSTDPIQELFPADDISGELSPWKLIENPSYTPIHEIDFMRDNELVFISKACGFVMVFPHRTMIVEILNEESHGVLMAVTYCPITRSGIAWNRIVGMDTLLLTPSGYLFRGNLVPLDLNSGNTWSQMRLLGMSGEHKGLTAETFPLLETTWNTARSHFPGAVVFTNQSQLKSTRSHHNISTSNFPVGQEFGILGSDAVELFTLEMFPGEISLKTTFVSPWGRIVVAGSTKYSFIVAFQTRYAMEPVAGEFPIIMKDGSGTFWNVFGEAMNGEHGGEKLVALVFYSAADWAWRDLFESVAYFEPDLP